MTLCLSSGTPGGQEGRQAGRIRKARQTEVCAGKEPARSAVLTGVRSPEGSEMRVGGMVFLTLEIGETGPGETRTQEQSCAGGTAKGGFGKQIPFGKWFEACG